MTEDILTLARQAIEDDNTHRELRLAQTVIEDTERIDSREEDIASWRAACEEAEARVRELETQLRSKWQDERAVDRLQLKQAEAERDAALRERDEALDDLENSRKWIRKAIILQKEQASRVEATHE